MKKILLFLLCLLVMTTCAEAAQLNNVAAVVNGKIITMFDLQKAAMPDLAALETEAADGVEKIAIRMGEDDLL